MQSDQKWKLTTGFKTKFDRGSRNLEVLGEWLNFSKNKKGFYDSMKDEKLCAQIMIHGITKSKHSIVSNSTSPVDSLGYLVPGKFVSNG